MTTNGLVPVVKSDIIKLLFRLIGSPGRIGVRTVRKQLDDQVQLVQNLGLTSHFLQYMSQSEMSLEVLWLNGQESIVVCLCHIVMPELRMTVCPEIKGCKVFLILTEHMPVFLNGIVPLLEVDVPLSLSQTQIGILRILTNQLIQRRDRVAPLLRGLRAR